MEDGVAVGRPGVQDDIVAPGLGAGLDEPPATRDACEDPDNIVCL